MTIPWILIAVGVLVFLLAIVFIFINKKKKIPPDYYTLFIVGITWFAIGLPLKNYFLWTVGLVLMAVGLANKDKWKKNHKTWKQLDKDEKNIRIVIISIVGVLVLIGFVFFFLVQKGIL